MTTPIPFGTKSISISVAAPVAVIVGVPLELNCTDPVPLGDNYISILASVPAAVILAGFPVVLPCNNKLLAV